MEFSIRPAEIKDSESITGLSIQLGYESNYSVTHKRLKEILKNDDNRVFVAIDNEKVIGWIHGFYTLRIESDSFIEIGGLVVSENYRKSGIGKTLIESVIKWAESRKYNSIRARCNIIRIESHKFYENIGFRINKEQKIFDKKLS